MKPLHIMVAGLLAGASALTAAGPLSAAEPIEAPPLPIVTQLAGKTLSAVTYTSTPAGSHNGALARSMLQAYLRPDGRALVRTWDAARNNYTPAMERRWTLEGNRLCLEIGTPPFCAEVHIWGARIAGLGELPYAMLDGDLRPGNAINGTR